MGNFKQFNVENVPFSFKMEVWEKSLLFQITGIDPETVVQNIIQSFTIKNSSRSSLSGSREFKSSNGILIQLNVGDSKPSLSRSFESKILDKIILPLHSNCNNIHKSVDLTEFHTIEAANASFNHCKVAMTNLNDLIERYYLEKDSNFRD